MRFLLFGILTFVAWSAIATHLYVCKIRGFCDDPVTKQIVAIDLKKDNPDSSGFTPDELKQSVIPANYIIYFAYNKSDFNANAETDTYFDESNAYLDENLKASINITGYTDSVGTEVYNQDLGYRRAQSIQHYFENKGIRAARIVIDSKGEMLPVADNTTENGRATNRRSVITIKK